MSSFMLMSDNPYYGTSLFRISGTVDVDVVVRTLTGSHELGYRMGWDGSTAKAEALDEAVQRVETFYVTDGSPHQLLEIQVCRTMEIYVKRHSLVHTQEDPMLIGSI